MNLPSAGYKTYLSVTIIFVVIYMGLIDIYSDRARASDNQNIKRHSSIVAHDLWTLNENNLKAYINLAANADGYKELLTFSIEGELRISDESQPLSGLDSLFYRIGLISTDELKSDISFKGKSIGTIHGEKYNKNIYSYLNIFILQVIVCLTLFIMLYLSGNRKILAKQVRERTKKYYDLVNLLPEMVLETDALGNIIYGNKIALEQFGSNKLDRSGLHCSDLMSISKVGVIIQADFFEFAKQGRLVQTECSAKRLDGTRFPVLVSSAPILIDEEIIGARFVVLDITERCALEAQLMRDRKMKSIGLMASGVAHDLNNILSGLVNYPELILLKYPNDEALEKYVLPMKKSGLEAAAVVSDLLTVARGVAASRNTININEIITDYMDSSDYHHLIDLHKNLSVSSKLDQEVMNIKCSVSQVRKCLMNLITNAAESMDEKGEITITTEKVSLNDADASVLNIQSGIYTTLSVQDNGPGISREHLENIFEPFYSKKKMGRSGTGLGLTIIWNVMQDHNGTVLVESGENKTLFRLYFPGSNEEVEQNAEVDDNDWKIYKGNGQSILVIDDDLRQRDIATQLLKELNYQVESVVSGEKALDYVQNRDVDLLLLDMIMGDGLNGRETYERILKKKSSQKAVIVSGFSESQDVKKTIHMGAGKLILKPYSKEVLAKAVFQELHKE